jgi:uncharacterized protein YoxC
VTEVRVLRPEDAEIALRRDPKIGLRADVKPDCLVETFVEPGRVGAGRPPFYDCAVHYDESPLRRAWLRGYRKADVELNLAQLRLLLQGTEQELDGTRRRNEELTAEVRELRDRDASVRAKEIELVEALSRVRQERERLDAEAQGRARELVLDAEARAAEVRSEALRRVEELQRQTDELMALRQRLVANVRHAVDEVDAVVKAVEMDVPPARPLVADLATRTRPPEG